MLHSSQSALNSEQALRNSWISANHPDAVSQQAQQATGPSQQPQQQHNYNTFQPNSHPHPHVLLEQDDYRLGGMLPANTNHPSQPLLAHQGNVGAGNNVPASSPHPHDAPSESLLPFSHPSYHDAICSHLFEVGFMKGYYADVSLHIPTLEPPKRFRLHSIILARSPLFHHLLSQQQPTDNNITLPLPDPYVSEEALFIALGHLYASYSQYRINNRNAPNVFMTALHLQIEDLAFLTAEYIKNNINIETVLSIVGFISDYQQMEENMRYMRETSAQGNLSHGAPHFGPWGTFASQQVAKMSQVCFDFLCKNGNKHLLAHVKGKVENGSPLNFTASNGQETHVSSNVSEASTATQVGSAEDLQTAKGNIEDNLSSKDSGSVAPDSAFMDQLISVYVNLPFEWLKRVIESKSFSLIADLDRYWFAKDIVTRRMERLDKSGACGIEENVVLAFGSFGGGEGSGRVAVVRKPPKNSSIRRDRVLWKVPGI
jgi:hypothetical protein